MVSSRSAKLVEAALKAKREGTSGESSSQNAVLSSPNVFLATYAKVNTASPPPVVRNRPSPRTLFTASNKENSPEKSKEQSEILAISRSPSPEVDGSDGWLSKYSTKLNEHSVRTYKSKLSRKPSAIKTPDFTKSKILSDKYQKSPLCTSKSPIRVDLEEGRAFSFRNTYDEESPMKKIRKDPREVGFDNLGNTCYINATMQCLLSVDSLVSDLLRSGVQRPHNKLLDCLFDLIDARKSGSTSRVSCTLRRWHSALGVLDEEFAGYRMQDANELIIQLFDFVKTQYDTYSKSHGQPASVMMTPEYSENDTDGSDEEVPSVSNNPIRSNFEFKLFEEFYCEECGEKSDEKEQIADSLWLPVHREKESPSTPDEESEEPFQIRYSAASPEPEPLPLAEALCEAMIEERESRCENCGKKTKNKADSKFSTLPRVLMIQLKRYVYREGNLEKVTNPIEIASTIDVSRFVTSKTRFPAAWKASEKDPPKSPASDEGIDVSETTAKSEPTSSEQKTPSSYRLVGVIQHIGSSAHSGHYIADVLSPSEKIWRHYDDTEVSQLSESSVVSEDASKNAYILFYVYSEVFDQMATLTEV